MEKQVRVRFAPSPTGALHIGGVRTALYNYLFAKKMGGIMILRIEDTDQTRFVAGAEKYIQESLEWCGIKLDESPWNGGQHAPYRQSERKPMYMAYALRLVEEGNAYYAFDTPEELEEMRTRLEAAKVVSPQYNAITRTQMKNSLTLPEDEVKRRLASGEPYVIRLKVPRKEEVRLQDMIRGWIMVHSSAIDDKVLMKSDGMPTYHLANVVDDHLMEITHVIRGDEWLPSAPLHVLLYKYFGWEDTMPQFAHLPVLLKPTGEGKLSKRDGDKFGFSVFPLQYHDPENPQNSSSGFREDGYTKEAFINFLAFLGWNPGQGSQKEMFSMEELIEAFSIERIGKAGIKFDINKAKWYNQQYLKLKSTTELTEFLFIDLKANHLVCEQSKAEKITDLLKERIVFPTDLYKEGIYFFKTPTTYDPEIVKSRWNDEVKTALNGIKEALSLESEITAASVKELIHSVLEKLGIKMGKVMQGVRLAITGVGAGADLMETMAILGKTEVLKRIELSLKVLG
ncbi:MAG: glutamate--tRNA ligase [Bacteroidetes bacterium]|nr:MAG: glutamate--tRNA ligase [Bacteroidota bacterium]